jgi:transcriptional regulator with XRE-family HTH domain
MPEKVVISAQVRAGRALLNWSQETLAEEAGVGVTTVRDIENQRRPADTHAMSELRRALANGGVIFVSGTPDGGPGVRFVGGRPHLLRRPEMTRSGDLNLTAEWQGREIDVVVTFEAVSTIGGAGFNTRQRDSAYLKVFDDHRGEILDALAAALNSGRSEPHGRVMLTAADFPHRDPLLSLSPYAAL